MTGQPARAKLVHTPAPNPPMGAVPQPRDVLLLFLSPTPAQTSKERLRSGAQPPHQGLSHGSSPTEARVEAKHGPPGARRDGDA